MCLTKAEWSQQMAARSGQDAEGWHCCDGLNKTDAERLLDWLEAHGVAQREVNYLDEQGFTVRWRQQ